MSFPQSLSLIHIFTRPMLVLSLIALAVLNVRSSTTATDGATPLALEPGAPAGAYTLSGLDNINLFNGNLNFRLPLGSVQGRGDIGTPIMLPFERKWRVLDVQLPQPDGTVDHVYVPVSSFWKVLPALYHPGTMEGRKAGWETITCPDSTLVFSQTLTRLTFTAPDGTEFELRDQLTNGQPTSVGCNYLNPPSRGTVFITADGSAATFISDQTIFDPTIAPGDAGAFTPSGFLLLRNGAKYRIDDGKVTWLRDRNGNKIVYDYDSSSRVITITDQIKRVISIAYASGASTYHEISFKGYGAALRTIRINFASLSTVLHSGTVQTFRQLFPELQGSTVTTFNPTVISSVTLPNNKEYQFRYNVYGELARVVLPTGGAYEYDYAGGGEYPSGTTCCGVDGSPNIYRQVIEKRVYSDGGTGSTFESKMTFSYFNGPQPNTMYTLVKHYKQGDSNPLAQQKHYFNGSPLSSFANLPTDYSPWNEGREYQTEVLSANGSTVLKRDVHTFAQRALVSWWPGSFASNNTIEPPNDPRTTQIVTTLDPSGQNLMSKVTYGYDDSVPFNNRNNVKVFDFGLGTPGALLRETRTTYLTSSTYTNANVHLRDLVSQVSTYDAGGVERSRTTAEFDNYTTDANHAALVNCANISGFDSSLNTSYVTRGNVTCTTRSTLVNGVVAGSVSSCRQFDIAGNAVKMIDARGFAITTEFVDRFGAPNGEARSNAAPTDLGGQLSYAFATKVTNAMGQTAYVQFDYYLSNPVDAEDMNGLVTSGYFNDALDRPTQVRRAVGTQVQNQTTFAYDDTARVITTTSDQSTNNDNVLVAKVIYDKLGRTIETRKYEGGPNYMATQTQYDSFGRVFKTSKPFRPWQNETVVWTTKLFDDLGRTLSITYPDNSVISNSYDGNAVTVTDQKLKKRKSIRDSLERLKHVYEDPDGLNYLTSYNYDVFDNVTSITQGVQTRAFVYDSLNRLTSATNPENGTTTYQYDNEGNVVVRTDARGVSAHFSYDPLNRPTRRWYNGSSSTGATAQNNPAIPSGVGISNEANLFYDAQSLPAGAPSFSRGSSIGKQIAVTYGTGASTGDYFGYDALGRATLKIQKTGSVNYQMGETYNLADDVTAMTYPSGRVVNYVYDSAGRTTSFSGNLGDGTTRTYAASFIYNSNNQITQELFGTAIPLYHKLQYNIRSQLWDVRVSTGSDVNGSMNRGGLQFFYDASLGYGTSGQDNNGNLLFSNTYIPQDDQANNWAIHRRSYAYDGLNRLTSSTEYFVSGTQAESLQSIQSYSYDQWGNRTINAGGTSGTGINNKVFTVNTATNRLGVPGGQSGTMSYDASGNLINDTYSGMGNRTYDAENKITSAWGGNDQNQVYSYDGNNQRIIRTIDGVAKWQIYGLSGELKAEYSANGAPTSPEKEYGYRRGELLVVGSSTGGSHSLSGNGTSAYLQAPSSSSLNIAGTITAEAWIKINAIGAYRAVISREAFQQTGTGGGYRLTVTDTGKVQLVLFQSHNTYVSLTGSTTITPNVWHHVAGVFDGSQMRVYLDGVLNGTLSTTSGPASGTGNLHIGRFSPSANPYYFNGLIDDARVSNVALYTNSFTPASDLTASASTKGLWKLNGQTANDFSGNGNHGTLQGGAGFSVDAPGSVSSSLIQWLIVDHLGTPRIILDQTGNLAGVKRHDYLPFGEELVAGTGGRATGQGYMPGDGVRQQFTRQERDYETGLDYFASRYYSSIQGRFTSSDPGSFTLADPQSLNRYSYVQNNPLKFIDPTGKDLYLHGREADYILSELEKFTGLRLQRDSLTGKVTIVPGSTRNKNGTSTHFANRLAQVIGDSRAQVTINTGRSQPNVFLDSIFLHALDVDDYDAMKRVDKKLAAAALGHVIEEYYYEKIIPLTPLQTDGERPSSPYGPRGPVRLPTMTDGGPIYEESHEAARHFESNVLSDFTGWWEQPRQGTATYNPYVGRVMTIHYSTVTYTIIIQNANIVSGTQHEKRKPRKY